MSLQSRSNLLNLATLDGGLPYTKVMPKGRSPFGLNTLDGGLPVFYRGLGFDGHVYVSNEWKSFTNGYVYVNGAWKELDELNTNVSGTWKQ